MIQLALFVLASASVAAYVCRLDSLRYGQHQLSIIVMHGSLLVACAWAALQAASGVADWGDFGVVIGSLSWIWVSLPTWEKGAPEHFDTGPTPLDDADLARVWGRGKD